MGQGCGVAQGLAIAGRTSPRFDVLLPHRRRRASGRPDLGSRHVRRARSTSTTCASWSIATTASSISRTGWCSRCRSSSGCSPRSTGTCTASTPRSTTGVYTALEALPLRAAQRQADGDHLPRDEGTRRTLRLPEQAQGRPCPMPLIEQELALQAAQRRDRVERVQCASIVRSAISPMASRSRTRSRRARRRMHLDTGARPGQEPLAEAGDGAGPDRARADAPQADSSTTRRAAPARSLAAVRRQRRRHSGDESVRQGSGGGVDRFGSRHHQRSRSRRRARSISAGR